MKGIGRHAGWIRLVASCAAALVMAMLTGCGGMETTSAPPSDASLGPDDAVAATAPDGSMVTGGGSPGVVLAPDAGDFRSTLADAGVAAAEVFDGGTCVPVTDAGVDGGCGNLKGDPHNCGSCGHDCNGGACESGACVPLPEGVLATGQTGPLSIAVDSTNVYWLNQGPFEGPGGKGGGYYPEGQVMKCAIAGCNNDPTILASGWSQAGGLPVVSSAIKVDSGTVYWVGSGEIFSCPIGGCGCAPRIIGSGMGGATAVTATGGYVFWTMYDSGDVGVCPATGCNGAPYLIATGQVGPAGITYDANDVYWTNFNGGLGAYSIASPVASPSIIWAGAVDSTQAATDALAVDGENLYFTNSNPEGTGSVLTCKKSACQATVTVLADGRSSPQGIVVDGATVYWSEDGAIYKCAIGGCNDSPTFVTESASQAIAIDATNLYLVQDGMDEMHIVKTPK
jgi:hypothetical protein